MTGLVLIYDADSGAVSAAVDATRKLFRIDGCSLCAVTHGVVAEKSEWKECREGFAVPVAALHRDEVPMALQSLVEGKLPCVVAEIADGASEILLGPEIIARSRGSVADLRGKLIYHASRLGLALLSPATGPSGAATTPP